ncbi:hypothetical protein [Peterkaempfera griseoplana]|uniref:hypothetical protein n=1 Tax=Peterkaempfera griseoplana TaxID=66896 RepID=UPI0012FEBD9E|nr:hypothetical protein [Peterkaempfera griseoplana]
MILSGALGGSGEQIHGLRGVARAAHDDGDEPVQARRRAVTGAHLVALVRTGAGFESGVLVDGEETAAA